MIFLQHTKLGPYNIAFPQGAPDLEYVRVQRLHPMRIRSADCLLPGLFLVAPNPRSATLRRETPFKLATSQKPRRERTHR